LTPNPLGDEEGGGAAWVGLLGQTDCWATCGRRGVS